MKQYKWPSGSEQNFETFMTNLQEAAFTNLLNRFSNLLKSHGLILNQVGDTLPNDFKVTVPTTTSLAIAGGKALTASGEYINYPGATITTLHTGKANGFYVVGLEYAQASSDPVQTMNAFVFDRLGATQPNTKNTTFNDSYTPFLLAVTTENFDDLVPASNRVYLGVVRIVSGVYSQANWASAYPTGTPTVISGVCDLREQNRLLFSEWLLDESKVFLKDRPSTGPRAIQQPVEFQNEVNITGSITFGIVPEVTIRGDQSRVSVSGYYGEHASFFVENMNPKAYVENLDVKTLRINVGTTETPVWRNALSAGDQPTIPQNFRIFDIYPTEDPNEGAGYVIFKWNWDELVLYDKSGTTLTIHDHDYLSNPLTPITTAVIGKSIYFPITGHAFKILNVSAGQGTYVLTVDGDVSEESTLLNYGAVITDLNTKSYSFQLTAGSQQGRTLKEKISQTLDQGFVENPSLVLRVPLGKTWFATIQGFNDLAQSPVVTMQAGSYDPDGDDGPQTSVSYNSPFLMVLPNITSTGNFDVIADQQGFTMTITGWEGLNNQTTAHEFEILYSDTVTIEAGTFSSSLANVSRVITKSRKIHIASPEPRRYSVGVRPLQNKQGVAAPTIKIVTSGGGGVAPVEQNLFQDRIGIKHLRFVYESVAIRTDGQKAYSFRAHTGYGLYEDLPTDYLEGKQFALPSLDAELITDPAAQFTFTNSTGGSVTTSAAYVSNLGAPSPKFLRFTASGTAIDNTNKNIEANWAKISTPTVSVAPGETLTFRGTVAMHNFGEAKVSFNIVDTVSSSVLSKIGFEKTTFIYPDAATYNTFPAAVSYTNTTAGAKTVKLEIRGWGHMAGQAGGNNHLIHVFYDFFSASLGFAKITDSGTGYGTYGVNFGEPKPLSFRKTASLTAASHYVPSTIRKLSHRGLPLYEIVFKTDPLLTSGSELVLGGTKPGRFIGTETLSVDYRITSIQFYAGNVDGASSVNPAIIRVYSKNAEGGYAALEVTGGGSNFVQVVNVPIQLDGNERVFVIDAFDDAAIGANNEAELSGTLIITGSPIVKNSFDR
jgi:hypothetical protein